MKHYVKKTLYVIQYLNHSKFATKVCIFLQISKFILNYFDLKQYFAAFITLCCAFFTESVHFMYVA